MAGRRGAEAPDASTLAELAEPGKVTGRIRKAPDQDPVAPTPVVKKQTPAATAKAKVGFYMDQADIDRARAAFVHTAGSTGHRSLSELMAKAIMRDVAKLEREHNGGQPFPSQAAGTVPRGRPLESRTKK